METLKIDIEQFKKNYLVSGLALADVERVAQLGEFKIAKSGFEILHMGRQECDLYVVLQGVAQVYAEGGVLLLETGENTVLGEMSLIDDYPRSAYVVAKGTLSYVQIEGNKLRRFMAANKDIGFVMLSNLSRVLTTRLREASKTVTELKGRQQDPWFFAL